MAQRLDSAKRERALITNLRPRWDRLNRVRGARKPPAGAVLSIGVGLLSLLTAGFNPACAETPTKEHTLATTGLVKTADGPVRGFVVNGVSEFLGIPYAAPPIGDLRWRPPQEVTPWTKALESDSKR